MEMFDEALDGPPRAAATVVMLRDTAAGLEVFLLRRHGLSDVLAGAHVFPGGKVDADDAAVDAAWHLDAPPELLHSALAEPALDAGAAVSLYVAAMREAFEETGVLYAKDVGPQQMRLAAQLHAEGHSFTWVLAQLGLRLEASRLRPWSRWITPRVGGAARKRFDTRFFLATVPPGQLPRHDNHEAVESSWLTPRAALAQYWEGRIELAPPQILSLAHLARHDCAAAAIAQAGLRAPPLVEPEPFEADGMRLVCYPGDERHSVRERALPGPTRLQYRNQRFEPVGGFDALFAQAR